MIKNHNPKTRKTELTNYAYIHEWNNRFHKKLGSCEFCGAIKKTEWALMHGKKHKRGIDNYLELCKKCHVNYDSTNDWMKKRKESLSKTYSHRNPVREIWCRWCDQLFKPVRATNVFCSNKCSAKGRKLWLELNK